jgi:hypothetical protein
MYFLHVSAAGSIAQFDFVVGTNSSTKTGKVVGLFLQKGVWFISPCTHRWSFTIHETGLPYWTLETSRVCLVYLCKTYRYKNIWVIFTWMTWSLTVYGYIHGSLRNGFTFPLIARTLVYNCTIKTSTTMQQSITCLDFMSNITLLVQGTSIKLIRLLSYVNNVARCITCGKKLFLLV